MQHTTKTLIAAAMAMAALSVSASAMPTMAQTTGPGDHALVNMALDRNYNCARSDAGTCLPDTALQMPDIPGMPGAGEGGASGIDSEINQLHIPATSSAQDASAGYIDPGDNRVFVAISVVCIAGILILIHQSIRQKNSP